MPHVSSKQMSDNALREISSFLFSAIIGQDMTKKQQHAAFNELLTQTEQIMLGKRLTAISMLSRGISPYEVGRKLCLSPTTTAKLKLKIEQGKLSNAQKLCDILRKGPLGRYLHNLLKPLPRYGTSPHHLFR